MEALERHLLERFIEVHGAISSNIKHNAEFPTEVEVETPDSMKYYQKYEEFKEQVTMVTYSLLCIQSH